jgi:hypothetical protein
MVELLKDILQALKVFGYGLLLIAYSLFIKVKKWFLALIGMMLFIGCVPYHRQFPTHGVRAMEVQCSVFSECERFARNSCIDGCYRTFAEGNHDLVFACMSPDNNRSLTFQ